MCKVYGIGVTYVTKSVYHIAILSQRLTIIQLADTDGFIEQFPRDPAVREGQDSNWGHQPGHEYLAANPVEVPALPTLLKAAETSHASKVVFPAPRHGAASDKDPFGILSAEITTMIINHLIPKDRANLRLCTRAVRQLPNILFRKLLLDEMPWMWELKDMEGARVDWHDLYCKRRAYWTSLKGLKNRERIWGDVEEIVRRIERLRSDGKIAA